MTSALLALALSSIGQLSQAAEPPSRVQPAPPAARPRVEVALPWTPPPGAYRWIVKALPSKERTSPRTVSLLEGIESQMLAAHQRRIAPLMVLSEECAVGRGPHESPEAAASFRRLVSERNRAVRALESLERDLLLQLGDSLELDDRSRAEIERGRLFRRRQVLQELP